MEVRTTIYCKERPVVDKVPGGGIFQSDATRRNDGKSRSVIDGNRIVLSQAAAQQHAGQKEREDYCDHYSLHHFSSSQAYVSIVNRSAGRHRLGLSEEPSLLRCDRDLRFQLDV